MKIQLIIYLLCFVAVFSVSLRAETTSPLFGGTASGVFEVSPVDKTTAHTLKFSQASAQFCRFPNCPKPQNSAIHASANAVQP